MEGGRSGTTRGTLSGSTLALDMPLHPHSRHPQQQQQQLHLHQHHLFPIPTAQPPEADHHPLQQQTGYAYPAYGSTRGKQQPTPSPEDEPGFGEEGVGAAADGTKRESPSPWHRMKWTDSMVRLLIMVVYFMGDDGGPEGDQHPQSTTATGKGKKASASPAAGGGLLLQQQKKGKWKSVSRAMMEKGFYVSPQQCEDKFNDLNKRYKRVNDLLGKGTACQVVENQALLDSMDHLNPRAKEEARKLLNSKHLFFREMCAYHNGGAAAATTPLPPPPQQPPTSDQSQHHHPIDAAARSRVEEAASVTAKEDHDGVNEDVDSEGVDEEEDYDEDSDDDDEEDDDHNTSKKHHPNHCHHHHQQGGDENEDSKGFIATAATTSTCSGTKRPRGTTLPQPTSSVSPPLSLSLWSPSATSMQPLRCELMGPAGRGEPQQGQGQGHWLRRRAAEVEEQLVGYQCQALQLERQRFKWLRFSSNKEREMQRMKLHNERLRLENERMLLLLRQKELELTNASGGTDSSVPVQFPADHHQQQKMMMLQQHTAATTTKDPPTAGAARPFDV